MTALAGAIRRAKTIAAAIPRGRPVGQELAGWLLNKAGIR